LPPGTNRPCTLILRLCGLCDKPLAAALAAGSEFLNLKAGFHCRGMKTSYGNDSE
ncbi:hypothetical protein PIB30_091704, partial [Stylosanthes scabra]|nr:hypothetical protein [Stylosanthes scabra]